MNAAIDQLCEKWIEANGQWPLVEAAMEKKYQRAPRPHYYNPASPERLPKGNNGLGLRLLGLSGDEVLTREVYEQLKAEALSQVRGTVQADILKEDQAQNTCIFSTEFALKLMGDVQSYFIDHKVRNFYSVSISGYHIAEAGANPITQLAFTFANGFTYVEYYLSRGMHIDDFAPNLSFFFSNGMDPEYSEVRLHSHRRFSQDWARTRDIAEPLSGLVDVDEAALGLIASFAARISRELQRDWHVEASTRRRDVLGGADVVTTSIGVGGLSAWRLDLDIPFKHGIVQPVGDTSGPGGLARALRHIPVHVEIAKDMEELCPEATLYNFSNPLTVNTQAVNRHSRIRCIGLCIGPDLTWDHLCRVIGVERRETSAVIGGINHCHWVIAVGVGR